ncbi:glycosyltransferase [Edwardsiella ictaluri]|nr:glycosyltransferase [Edwardsiella ictaluri]ELV7529229.1 glycosyltransferase [Edwardsiella ictaluri]KMQ79462.1 glycosyl transferase [Edwardsiella ictaluri]KOO56090.1 glycosyl transferase [Edwardsiella ictaluri]UYB62767.1 glycosyltransferase [Edwardsiella ictaluri]UYB65993.1 glycosyltransferase [Edwardsiella ictaluri]
MSNFSLNKVCRVCFVITGLGMGGAEKQVCDLADSLSIGNIDIIIINLTGEAILKPVSSNVTIYSINMKKNLMGFISALLKVRKILARFKPDIVHSHMYHANIFSRILRLTYPFPKLICTAHSTNEGGRIRMLLYRITDFLATISTNVSQEAVVAFEKNKAIKKGRMLLVYNGINTNKYKFSEDARYKKRKELSITDNDRLILAVGRLTAAKNYHNLLLAFSMLPCKDNVFLAIAGDGEDKISLINLAMELNINDHVLWLGLRYDISELMSAMDIYAMSSSWEGMPLVLCEAMSCGGKVIATDCGGVKEIIGDAGMIIERDNPRRLADGIDFLLKSESIDRNRCSCKARERILLNYSLESVSARWLSLYTSKV